MQRYRYLGMSICRCRGDRFLFSSMLVTTNDGAVKDGHLLEQLSKGIEERGFNRNKNSKPKTLGRTTQLTECIVFWNGPKLWAHVFIFFIQNNSFFNGCWGPLIQSTWVPGHFLIVFYYFECAEANGTKQLVRLSLKEHSSLPECIFFQIAYICATNKIHY